MPFSCLLMLLCYLSGLELLCALENDFEASCGFCSNRSVADCRFSSLYTLFLFCCLFKNPQHHAHTCSIWVAKVFMKSSQILLCCGLLADNLHPPSFFSYPQRSEQKHSAYVVLLIKMDISTYHIFFAVLSFKKTYVLKTRSSSSKFLLFNDCGSVITQSTII